MRQPCSGLAEVVLPEAIDSIVRHQHLSHLVPTLSISIYAVRPNVALHFPTARLLRRLDRNPLPGASHAIFPLSGPHSARRCSPLPPPIIRTSSTSSPTTSAMATSSVSIPRARSPRRTSIALAAEGMGFTDAHSVLGRLHADALRHPDRPLQLAVARSRAACWAATRPRLIEPGRLTVPALLKQHGYHTACIGKWHLGMDWPLKDGGTRHRGRSPTAGRSITPSRSRTAQHRVGFDYFFGISASLDMPPSSSSRTTAARAMPTVEKTWIREGAGPQGLRGRRRAAHAHRKAVDYIRKPGRQARTGEPFFLYLRADRPAHADPADYRVAGQERPQRLRRFRHAGGRHRRRGPRRPRSSAASPTTRW